MWSAKPVSITVPPDLLEKARATVGHEKKRNLDLVQEALRRYMVDDPEWEAF